MTLSTNLWHRHKPRLGIGSSGTARGYLRGSYGGLKPHRLPGGSVHSLIVDTGDAVSVGVGDGTEQLQGVNSLSVAFPGFSAAAFFLTWTGTQYTATGPSGLYSWIASQPSARAVIRPVVAPGYRWTIGTNLDFSEIRGYLVAGESGGPYGALSPLAVAGLPVNRFQVNTGNNLVILSLGPSGAGTEQIPGVTAITVTFGDESATMAWTGASLFRYQVSDGGFASATLAASGSTVSISFGV